MKSKLTLKLTTRVIKRAKQYVHRGHAKSLSRLVERYFNSLTKQEIKQEKKLPPIVSSLAGAAKKTRISNSKEEYTDCLIQKYR